MKSIQKMALPSLTLSLLMASSLAFAESPAPKKAAAKPAASAPGKADEAAMMAAMAKYTEPNENHQKLKPFVGTWDVVAKWWMGPGQKATETKGVAEKKMVLGDRFVQEDYKGTMMGKPFVGQGLTGYDNAKKKFTNLWVDTMSTALMLAEGDMDAAGKTLTMTSTSFDVAEQKNKTSRTVTHFESDKKHVFEWFTNAPDGKEFKVMEIVYTKKP